MKWLTRKPNWTVHAGVCFACLILIVSMRALVKHQFGFYESNVNRWVFGGMKDGPLGRVEDGLLNAGSLPSMIVVGEQDGALITWTEQDAGFRTAMVKPKSALLFYWTGEYQTGFWAPTRRHKAQLLFDSDDYARNIRDWSIDPPAQQQLDIQAAVVEGRNFDPRLATTQYIEETGIIPLGYVLNTLWLLALAGIGWWCWWTPTKVRDYWANRRKAKDLCPVCMYDVSATPSRCPECGWGHDGNGNGDVSGGNGA